MKYSKFFSITICLFILLLIANSCTVIDTPSAGESVTAAESVSASSTEPDTEPDTEPVTCDPYNDIESHQYGAWTYMDEDFHEQKCTVPGCKGRMQARHGWKQIGSEDGKVQYGCSICRATKTVDETAADTAS